MNGGPYAGRAAGLPLFLTGAFMVYLAATDGTLFDYVLNIAGHTRPAVAAATVAATAPLMFFAVGFVKMAVLRDWQTIYQYEILLRRRAFSIMAIALLLGIAAINAAEHGVHPLNAHVLAGCIGFSAYLALRTARSGTGGAAA